MSAVSHHISSREQPCQIHYTTVGYAVPSRRCTKLKEEKEAGDHYNNVAQTEGLRGAGGGGRRDFSGCI
jgi:hypothetical protein